MKTAWKSMTSHERDQFEKDGYLLIRGALSPDEVDFYRDAMDRVYAEPLMARCIC